MNAPRILHALPLALLFAACGAAGDNEEFGQPLQEETAAEEAASLNSALHVPDPTTRGPHAVSTATYGSDTQRSTVEGVFSEHLGQVYYPSDMENGPYPLVMFMHGDHRTNCIEPDGGAPTDDPWPCRAPNVPIESYRGFDYVAELLASHGMVVASISANGMNDVQDPLIDLSPVPRATLLNRHINQFDHFNAFGEDAFNAFPGVEAFQNKIDMGRVALVGHSRGGQAVMAYPRNFPDSAATIRAILPIAPANPDTVNNIPVGTVLGYCDSDLQNLAGLFGFDDARYEDESDETEKYAFLLPGANHAFFNAIWSPDHYANPPQHAEDDALEEFPGFEDDPHCDPNVPGNRRLTGVEQRNVAASYISSFLRRHLLNDGAFDPVLKGDAAPAPQSLTESVQVSYHAGASERRDVNRLNSRNEFDAGENTMGEEFSAEGFSTVESCSGRNCVEQARGGHQHRRLKLSWDSAGAVYSNDLASGQQNVRNFDVLQFRVGTDHNDPDNSSPRDLSVRLVDTRGGSRSVTAARFTNAFELPPGEGDTRMSLMSTVRIPLSEFRGVNRTRVARVELVFDQQSSGTLLVSDLTFSE